MARKSGKGQAVSLERIKQEAIRLFGERGYPVIGMRDLSEAVGILPGSLYSHISSKEHLLLAIVETGITAFIDAIRPVVDEDLTAEEKLREALRAHMRVLAGQVEQTRARSISGSTSDARTGSRLKRSARSGRASSTGSSPRASLPGSFVRASTPASPC